MLAMAGCISIFTPKHKVLVDSIKAPGTEKPAGKSYRLLAKKSVVAQPQVQVSVVKACVDSALVGLGMYEQPQDLAPDLFIEVSYGTETAGRVDPSSRETFLQLSARENPERSLDRGSGAEVWDVRVAVLGIMGRVETAMPLLSAVAANYVATDTHMETKIEIPQNSPMVASVREGAIKSLEGKSPAAPASGAPASPPGASASTPATPPTAGGPTTK